MQTENGQAGISDNEDLLQLCILIAIQTGRGDHRGVDITLKHWI